MKGFSLKTKRRIKNKKPSYHVTSFGRAVREYRYESNTSLEELAGFVGMSTKDLRDIEIGLASSTRELTEKIIKCLGVDTGGAVMLHRLDVINRLDVNFDLRDMSDVQKILVSELHRNINKLNLTEIDSIMGILGSASTREIVTNDSRSKKTNRSTKKRRAKKSQAQAKDGSQSETS